MELHIRKFKARLRNLEKSYGKAVLTSKFKIAKLKTKPPETSCCFGTNTLQVILSQLVEARDNSRRA